MILVSNSAHLSVLFCKGTNFYVGSDTSQI